MKTNKLLLLVSVTMLLLLAACGNKDDQIETDNKSEENFNETGMPIVNEPITIQFMTGKAATTENDYNDVLIWEKYAEMTNINIDWGPVLSSVVDEKRNLSLAGGDYPEVFYTSFFPDGDISKYGSEGVFLALNDLIDQHMPNVKSMFEKYPEIEKGLTFADGNIYSLPTAYSPEFKSMTSNIKPWIKQEWLDTLGMDMPQTTEEFYLYLKAVKEKDPNGNGETDEIPYGSNSMDGLIGWLKGAYGVGNKGRKHSFVDQDPETDELRFYRTSDRYKEMLEYIHKLFDEGLIQENIFTIETNEYHDVGSRGLYGSTVTTSPETRFGSAEDDYVGMPQLTGPHGDREWVYVTAPIVHKGSFIMTDKNKHQAETARWIDYFYGEEGGKLLFMGVEGVTYEEAEDGELQYVEEITNNPDGLTLEQALKPYITWLGGGYPGLVESEFFKGAENAPSSVRATELIEPDMIEEAWSSFAYTLEEEQKLVALKADIEKYANEIQDKLIFGETSFSQWDKYVETLEKMGLEEYMEIQNAAYERYKGN